MSTFIPKIVLDVDDAAGDMKELLTLALRDVSVLDKINEFLKSGRSSFVVAKADRVLTKGTKKIFTLFKLANPLHILLLAARASNV